MRAVAAHPHPGRLRDRPRAGQPAARPGGRRARLDPDRRRQAGRARRRRGARAGRPLRQRGRQALDRRLAPRAARPRRGPRPGRRWPTRSGLVDAASRGRRGCATAPVACCDHQLDRAADDLGHQPARVRGAVPLATLRRGYAVVQHADGHVVTDREQVRAGRRSGPGGRRPDRRHRRAPRPTRRRPTSRGRRPPSYEEAREELVEVVRGSRPAAPTSRSRSRCGSAARSSPRSARSGWTAPEARLDAAIAGDEADGSDDGE